jgi:hypothetical protein
MLFCDTMALWSLPVALGIAESLPDSNVKRKLPIDI